jgi:AcrR family transcriptional regulator
MTEAKGESVQRILDVAGDIFVWHRLEDVSMSTIAQLAHCSTATLYQAFGSKENLFVSAMGHRLDRSVPSVQEPLHAGFVALLHIVRVRIETVSTPPNRALFRALCRQPELMQRPINEIMKRVRQRFIDLLDPQIRVAIEEGLLRPLPQAVISNAIMGLSVYEASQTSLLFGNDDSASLAQTLRQTFLPLVSEKGAEVLDRYLRTLEGTQRPGASSGSS